MSMESSECRVYSKWTATRQDGITVNLRVQDMPPEGQETVVDLFVNIYSKEEMVYRALGVYDNEESRAELRQFWQLLYQVLPSHTEVCCVDGGADDGKIVAAGIKILCEGRYNWDTFPYEAKTPQCKKLTRILAEFDNYDFGKEHNVERWYEDQGATVLPEYRRLGIMKEFAKARRMVCKINKVPVTAAWLTAYGTQKAAEGNGWQTAVEYPSEDLARKFDLVLDDCDPPTIKLMLAWVEI